MKTYKTLFELAWEYLSRYFRSLLRLGMMTVIGLSLPATADGLIRKTAEYGTKTNEVEKLSSLDDASKVEFVDGLAVDLMVTNEEEKNTVEEEPRQAFVGKVPRVSAIPMSQAFSVGLSVLPNEVGRAVVNPQLEGVPANAQSRLNALLEAQEWEEAYLMVEDIVLAHPGQTNLVHQAAILASLCNRYEDANRYYSQHAKRFPRDSVTLSAWASVLLYMGRHDQARVIAQRAKEANPANLHAYLMLLCVDLAVGKPLSDEEELFWKKLGLAEMGTIAGWLAADVDKFKLGLTDPAWNRLCELTLGYGTSPNLTLIPDTLHSANREMANGKWLKALVYFDLGKSYGLDGVEFQQNMARCYYEVGNQVDALKIMHGLTLQFGDSATVWYNYGFILINFRIYDEAATAFKRAHELAPDSGETYFALACAYIGMGKKSLAWGILDLLAKTHPQHMERWVEGDKPYFKAIREDARFPDLMEEVEKNLKNS